MDSLELEKKLEALSEGKRAVGEAQKELALTVVKDRCPALLDRVGAFFDRIVLGVYPNFLIVLIGAAEQGEQKLEEVLGKLEENPGLLVIEENFLAFVGKVVRGAESS